MILTIVRNRRVEISLVGSCLSGLRRKVHLRCKPLVRLGIARPNDVLGVFVNYDEGGSSAVDVFVGAAN